MQLVTLFALNAEIGLLQGQPYHLDISAELLNLSAVDALSEILQHLG
jgi:hypothetical protein